MIEYAHLHCHTKYSVQDAMPSCKEYVDEIYRQNQNSSKYHCIGLAISDHGVMYALPKQYEACNNPDHKERKTKALYACEIYHCLDINNNPEKTRFHMVLIAATQEGLTNLYQIVSHAGIHAIQGRRKPFPVTDLNFMKDHGKGIIALTACVGGYIPQLILNGTSEKDVIKEIDKLYDIFDDVYLEVQPHEFKEQLLVNKNMVEISKTTGYKLVMTSDSHYIHADDSKYHDILKQISHQIPFEGVNNHLYSAEEMEEYCLKYNIPLDCISNTAIIANKCKVDPKPKDHKGLLPVFPCPDGYEEDSYLRELSFQKLQEKIINKQIPDPVKYINQMNYELEIICNAGFAGYFLILWDWFDWCRKNNILMGPGRGSAAGSIVSYALDITKVDPIKNGFFFERFLSSERLAFPDIDSDVPRNKRAKAISYLQQKYGKRNVSQIITFGEYKLKNTIKAVMSYLGCPYQEGNEVTKSLPDMVDGNEVTYDFIEKVATDPDNEKFSSLTEKEKTDLKKVYDKLQELFSKYPMVYHAVKNICGVIASTGIHAGGVIVCSKPIDENGALIDGGKTAVLPVLQFEMSDLDMFGFLKIDALGLKTLDIIHKTMELAGLGYDWYDSEDYTDQDVFTILKEGETTDIFQMSTYTPTMMIKDFDVHNIEGICAVNAGNRPGPLEKDKDTGKSMVDTYAERIKTGVIESYHPNIDPILKETMGCIWYQETCMDLGRIMAGYSLGNADARIRTVLGKKKKKLIPEIRNEFIYGKKSIYDEDHNVIGMNDEPSPYCVGSLARGYSLELSEKIFDSMEAFAKYAFNKAHAFCYGVLAYKEAWLSKHYPLEFAIANCTINDSDDIINTLALARKRKISILPPDINNSDIGFSADNGAIRYGLKAIKGIGSSVLDFISRYRNTENYTPFRDFDEFLARMKSETKIAYILQDMAKNTGERIINPIKKNIIIAFILAGAFDFCEKNRYKLINTYIQSRGEKEVKIMDTVLPCPLDIKTYDRKAKLALEKYYMGTYISEHPLDPFPYTDIDTCNENDVVQIAGIVTEAKVKKTKTGKDYLTIKFKAKDDIERNVNMFNEKKALELKKDLKKNSIIVVYGNVSKKYNNINAKSIKIAIAKTEKLMETEKIVIDEDTYEVKVLPDIFMTTNVPKPDLFA